MLTPMQWIANTRGHATKRLLGSADYLEAQHVAVTALAAGNPVAGSATATLTAVDPMLAQFASHYAAIDTNQAIYIDFEFYTVDRWFDPAPPVLVDPGP